MKKSISLAVLACLLTAATALAVVDPDPNSMGIYFDLNADTYELAAVPFQYVDAYVMLTNPDFDELYGYEFYFLIEGRFMLLGVILNGDAPITTDGCINGNCIAGLRTPLATTEATLIATLRVVLLDAEPVSFTLTGAIPSSVGDSRFPALLLANNEIRAMGLAVWDDETQMPGVCAVINSGASPVAIEETTWDAIKSVYR